MDEPTKEIIVFKSRRKEGNWLWFKNTELNKKGILNMEESMLIEVPCSWGPDELDNYLKMMQFIYGDEDE